MALASAAPRLRPYQLDAQRAIVDARRRGIRTQLVSIATGLGKTVIIATLPKLLELRPNEVTLVIAHRDELIEQIQSKMRAESPEAKIGIEKAEQRAAEDCNIVVATVQTLGEKRLSDFIARFGRRIALFIIDEAHHAAAPSYRAIVDAITAKRSDAIVLGFTATPNRGDGVGLVDVFQTIVYSMDTRQAIDQGYLVPVRSFAVATKTNLDDVASRGGDFVVGQLAAAVNTADRNARIVDAYRRHTPDQKALVFTASVEHARSVYESFAGAGVAAAFASGETPKEERERIVADFRADRINVLVNCGLYLEGFDVPSIRVVINARPTKSTALYTQITGRALRPVDEIANELSALEANDVRRSLIAESPKPYAMILDMVDQAQRHQLVTLPSLYGLPPQIDVQGRPVSQVAERFEELLHRAPREAAKVRTAEQIETALYELDALAEGPSGPNHVAAWQPLEPEHWRLERPAQRTARDRKGRPIPNFGKIYEQYVLEAKRIAPHENAEAFAQRILDVDPRSIRDEQVTIEVFRRGKDIVTTVSSGTLPPREVALDSTLARAIGEAEVRVDEALRAQAAQAQTNRALAEAKARRPRRGKRKRQVRPGASAPAAAATNGAAPEPRHAGYLDFGDWSAAEI